MRIVLTGPPGGGKGTQAQLLSTTLALPHVSTGDLFRHHIGTGTELGTKAKSYIDAGALVPSDLTVDMVRDRLTEDDTGGGFILDGFPRTLDQATALDGLLARRTHAVTVVLDFAVSEDAAVTRMLARGRGDDTEAVIRERLAVYARENQPVIDHYAAVLVRVDGEGAVEEVHARAVNVLEMRSSVLGTADRR